MSHRLYAFKPAHRQGTIRVFER